MKRFTFHVFLACLYTSCFVLLQTMIYLLTHPTSPVLHQTEIGQLLYYSNDWHATKLLRDTTKEETDQKTIIELEGSVKILVHNT